MSRKFYTSDDIEKLKIKGERELIVDENDVVMELAKEAAARYGIKITLRSAVAGVPPAEKDGKIRPPYDIQMWRKQFPILENGIHLANCSQSPSLSEYEVPLRAISIIGTKWE